MKDAPIVTFVRNGRELTLGRTGTDTTIHMRGATGLGIAPVDIAKSDRLAGDGSIVRGVRYGDRDVFIPLFVRQPSMGDLHRWRQSLARLLAPIPGDPDRSRVDVRVEDPTTGTVRTVRGIYKDGLSGDFGDDYHDHWQTIGLLLDCADPWWLGPEQVRSLRPSAGVKPFLSDGEVVVERTNRAVNPSFETGLGQNSGLVPMFSGNATGELDTAWAATGAQSVRIDPTGNNDTTFYPWGNRASSIGAALGLTEGTTVTIGATIHLDAPQTGTLHAHARCIRVNRNDGTSTQFSWAVSEPAPNTAGDHRVTVTFTVPAGTAGMHINLCNGSDTGPVWWDDLTFEHGSTDGSYFDGDSDGAYWTGEPGSSTSAILTPDSAEPFFPVILAESVVLDEWTIRVDGDAEVWPTWEITGPGSDLLIESATTGERIFIAGDFRAETVTRISTRPARISPDRWDDVSLDSRLFPLQRGPNQLRVSMVGATTDTVVRLVWQERYLEAI